MNARILTLVFRIDGEDVAPQSVRVRDLLQLLTDLETTIAATAKSLGAADDKELFISLVGIDDGSDQLTLAMGQPMHAAAIVVTHAIKNEDFKDIPLPAKDRLRDLWRKAKDRSWTMSILSHVNGNELARLSPDHEILGLVDFRAPTVIYGKIDRVGGEAKGTASLVLPTGKRLTIETASRKLTEELGQRLFRFVGLEGTATWGGDWELSKFRADKLVEYEDTDAITAFKNLSAVVGGIWDETDPEEYVSALRADE